MSTNRILVQADPDLADLIPGFLDNRRADVTRLTGLIAAGDATAVRKLGHDLKGCGSAYGFDPISELGARIELAAIQNNLAAVTPLRAELADYLERIDVKYGG